MDIVLPIALITALACVEVCAALLYRGWELSREDVPEHIHTHRAMRTYAEDSVDRMVTVLKAGIARTWHSHIIPAGVRVKKNIVRAAADFAPTAYVMRVYNAIRGLHTGHEHEEGENASSFLQEVHAHKNGNTHTYEKQVSEERAEESSKKAEEHDKK